MGSCFPDSSVGKVSTCNAGDPSSIPESGSFTVEGLGCPLQYSWAFLVAQMVKNVPEMQKTQVQSLKGEDPLGKGMATHSSILAMEDPMDRGGWWATVHGVAESWTRLKRLSMHTHGSLFMKQLALCGSSP